MAQSLDLASFKEELTPINSLLITITTLTSNLNRPEFRPGQHIQATEWIIPQVNTNKTVNNADYNRNSVLK